MCTKVVARQVKVKVLLLVADKGRAYVYVLGVEEEGGGREGRCVMK